MKRFRAEAAGNTFLVLYTTENLTKPLAYLNTLRRTHQWNFDTALVMLERGGSIELLVLERDHSRSASCGNGLRAIAWVLDYLGKERQVLVDGQMVRIRRIANRGDEVIYRVPMGRVTRKANVHLPKHSDPVPMYLVQDEPHVVIQVPSISLDELERVGRLIPWSNCTMVAWGNAPQKIQALTFERGLCRIPQSSGTGACAAVQACRDWKFPLENSVTVQMLNDEPLIVSGDSTGLVLQGSVRVMVDDEAEVFAQSFFDLHHEQPSDQGYKL